jgi:hypothetical protein
MKKYGVRARKGCLLARTWYRLTHGQTVRKHKNFDDMKADEYRYWQSQPVHERMDAVEEMIQTAYELKGCKMEPDVLRPTKTFCSHSMPMALNT